MFALTNQQLAIAFTLTIVTLILIFNRKLRAAVDEQLKDVWDGFPPMLTLFTIFYSTEVIIQLFKLDLWTIQQAPATICWFLLFPLLLLYTQMCQDFDRYFFIRTYTCFLSLTSIVTLFTAFGDMALGWQLLFHGLGIIGFIAYFQWVALSTANGPTTFMLLNTLAGIALLLNCVIRLIFTPGEPQPLVPLLSLVHLPFFYITGILLAYRSALDNVSNKLFPGLKRYAAIRLFAAFRLRYTLLNDWVDATESFPKLYEAEINQAIREVKERRKKARQQAPIQEEHFRNKPSFKIKETINVANDFSKSPGLRFAKLSEHSGEEFYYTVLNPAFTRCFSNKGALLVDLDLVDGYAPSFLDEAFGRLVYDFGKEVVNKHLKIKSEDEPHWIRDISTRAVPLWEQRRLANEGPEMTGSFGFWHKLVADMIVRVTAH